MSSKIDQFLEDLHPSVRSNVRLGVGLAALVLALHGVLFVALRVLDSELLLRSMGALQLFHTLLLLLLILMIYNAARALVLYFRHDELYTGRAAFLAVASVILLGLATLNMPNILQRSVAFEAGRPYTEVLADARTLCDDWEADWADQESVLLVIEDEDLGRLDGETEAYKIAKSIFFNFSQGDLDFGIACVLKNEQPSNSARASRYTYHHVDGPMYEFVEQDKDTR